MANLSLWQCDVCGWAEFTTQGYSGPVDGAEVKYNLDGTTLRICCSCVAHLEARRGMFELTGDAKTPVKRVKVWPPDREENSDRKGYTG